MENSKFKIHQFGKYVLLEEVATGGMAIVYKALGKTIDGKNHYFAIKRILPNFSGDEEFISLLKDEAKLMVQLNHPNIVSLIEFGKVSDDYYICMEYIEGTTLKGMIQRVLAMGNTFTIDMATHVVREIAAGLSYAHRKLSEDGKPLEIVHRDISPANILISYEGEVKITDFGISKAKTQTHFTQTGIIRGKTGYMSPEQTRSDILIDHRSDLFALGVIFFELLTGKKLFYAKSIPEAIRLVREGKVPPLKDFRSDIPRDLEKILLKLLEQKPENRFQRAEDLMDALNEFLTRFSPAGRPLRITHVDLIGFLRRFYPQEIAMAVKSESLISHKMQDAYSKQPLSIVAAQFEKLKTLVTNPLFEISVPVDTYKRPVSTLKGRNLSGSITQATEGSVSPVAKDETEVTESETKVSYARKYIKWVVVAVLVFSLGFLMREYQNRVQQSYRSVTIATEPAGAQVWINGTLQKNITPSEYQISKNRPMVLIGIQKKGYRLIQQNRKVEDLGSPSLFKLEPEPSVSTLSKVLLNSEPADVHVVMNGQEIKGTTPLELELEVGKTYQLKFRKEGFKSKETTLTVDVPGSLEKTVSLTPIKKGVRVIPETKVSLPTQLGRPGKKVVNLGKLSVTSNPWAYMYLDKKKIGETPLIGFSTAPGKHVLRLSNPSLNLKDKEVTVEILGNKHMKCAYEFETDILQCF